MEVGQLPGQLQWLNGVIFTVMYSHVHICHFTTAFYVLEPAQLVPLITAFIPFTLQNEEWHS